MKLKAIRIQNLGPYRKVDFELSNYASGLVFVNGNNGRGKTTLLNCLKWCLFRGLRPDVSKSAILNDGVSSPIEVRVEVEIEHEDGSILILEKSQMITVMNDLTTEKPVGQPVLKGKIRKPNDPTQNLEDASRAISEWFPTKLENFILFDAEQLAKFFSPETRLAIEEAVHQIAGVENLDLAINGIRGHLTKFRREFSKLGGKEVEKLQTNLEEAEGLRDAAQTKLNELESQRTNADLELSEVRREMGRHEAAREYLETIDDLRTDVATRETNLKSSEREFERELLFNAHLFLVSETLLSVDEFYEEGLAQGYPLAFPSETLREILAADSCVCGCDLEKTGHRKNVEELLKRQAKAEGIDKSLPSTRTQSMFLREKMLSTQKSLNLINSGIATEGSSLATAKANLRKLEEAEIDEAGWAALSAAERRENAKLNTAQQQLPGAKRDLDSKTQRVTQLRKEIEAAATNDRQSRRLRTIVQFLEKSLEFAEATRQAAITAVRKELEKAMNENYANIKSGTFEVEITERFEVRLRNHDTQKISEGETMSLAYSFAIAIRTALGMQFPLVVDSAFGKLDSSNRDWLAKSLVSLVTGDSRRQAVFLMHDLEYTPATAEVFKSANPKEFYLSHNAEEKVTEILEGIDPSWSKSSASPWYGK